MVPGNLGGISLEKCPSCERAGYRGFLSFQIRARRSFLPLPGANCARMNVRGETAFERGQVLRNSPVSSDLAGKRSGIAITPFIARWLAESLAFIWKVAALKSANLTLALGSRGVHRVSMMSGYWLAFPKVVRNVWS